MLMIVPSFLVRLSFLSFLVRLSFLSFLEVYPPFHSYAHAYAHALCFTIQTLYSYSLQIMLSLNTLNQST
jgi:hypothetical protein